jgi:hypothetical protein
VTAIAKSEPHHWTSMGGDAQKGALSVMFDGPRINSTYDPMRKQVAIRGLLFPRDRKAVNVDTYWHPMANF